MSVGLIPYNFGQILLNYASCSSHSVVYFHFSTLPPKHLKLLLLNLFSIQPCSTRFLSRYVFDITMSFWILIFPFIFARSSSITNQGRLQTSIQYPNVTFSFFFHSVCLFNPLPRQQVSNFFDS